MVSKTLADVDRYRQAKIDLPQIQQHVLKAIDVIEKDSSYTSTTYPATESDGYKNLLSLVGKLQDEISYDGLSDYEKTKHNLQKVVDSAPVTTGG